jgi:hypothetical protein
MELIQMKTVQMVKQKKNLKRKKQMKMKRKSVNNNDISDQKILINKQKLISKFKFSF